MAPEWIYLLKVNAGIALFYAFYKLFCCKDTFFHWRRFALLGFLAVSFLYPALNFEHWVKEQPSMNGLADYYAEWIYMDEVMVETAPVSPTPDLVTMLGYMWMVGVGVMALRFLVQLFSIFSLVWRGKKERVDGVRVVCLEEASNPFSFFGWIFVHLPHLKEDNRQEILMHELTHVRQGHSMDVVISELITIVCWMNPFMWLLKAEIRLNLEYLADSKVTEGMESPKEYQYHLLGLANQNRQTGLYNHFNVSHLKNRIVMMNKKRTSATGRIKYALFAPLAVALLLVSNIETVARTTVNLAEDMVSELTDAAPQDTARVFMVVEQMPEFPGGMAACMEFLKNNIKYPKEAREKKEQGRVILQFVVMEDGSLSDIKIVRGVSPSIDAEAIRIMNQMPKWKPGMQRGQAVRVKYTIPVMFSLDDENQGDVDIKREVTQDEYGFYMVADEMPEFPGGMAACMEWLQKNIRYPIEAFAKSETGRVIVQFVVEENGDLRQLKVVRGVSPSLDGEALRVVATMPKWKPGKVDGKPVKVNYTIPIAFRLTGVEEAKKTVSADELRKLPGTEVDENGNIKVNGKAVKGILVDGVAAEVK